MILAFSRIWEGENVLKVPVSVWLEVMGARVIMSVALTSASIRSARGTSRFGLCVCLFESLYCGRKELELITD